MSVRTTCEFVHKSFVEVVVCSMESMKIVSMQEIMTELKIR